MGMSTADALGFLAKVGQISNRRLSERMGHASNYVTICTSRDSGISADELAKAAAAVGWELRLVDPNGRDYVTIGEPTATLPHPVTSGIELPQDANYTIG